MKIDEPIIREQNAVRIDGFKSSVPVGGSWGLCLLLLLFIGLMLGLAWQEE